MKLKKLLAGVTAAALAVGLVAVTPLMASADDTVIDTDINVSGTFGKWEEYNIARFGSAFDGCDWPNGIDYACDDYDKMIVDVTVTDPGNAAEIDFIFNSGDAHETTGDGIKFVAKGFNLKAGENQIFEISLADYAGKYINYIGYEVYTKVESNAEQSFTGDITINSVTLTPADTTKYSTTTIDLPEPNEWDFYVFDGTWDISAIEGNNASLIITPDVTTGGAVITVESLDNTVIVDWTWVNAGDSLTVKLNVIPAEGIRIKAVNGTEVYNLSSVKIKNKEGNDPVYTAKTDIPVTDIPVTDITVTGAPTEAMKIGATAELTAKVEPKDATESGVTWSSSDEKVATVDENGKVKAVGVGTTTITATAKDGSEVTGTAKITVIAEVTPSINVTEVTVNKELLDDQINEVDGKVKVTIDGLTEGTDFKTAVTMDKEAGESDSTATVTVTLTPAGAAKYEIAKGKETFKVGVKFVDLDSSEYKGYTAETTIDIDAAEGDTDDDVKAAVQTAIEAKTVTLKGVGTGDQTGKIGTAKIDMDLSSIKAETGEYTVSVDVNVYKIIRQGKDLYYSEDVTLGDSRKASDKITLTFTVNVTAPEKPEEPTPEKPTPEKPTPEEPTPEEPTPEKPTPEEPTPEEPTPENPTPVNPTPAAPVTPETPVIVPTAANNRVGDGGSVPTDVNTGAAFTGTRAMEEISRAKSGSSINVVMTNGMSEGEIIAKIAYKKDVTINLKYSAYTVSINSDDVAEDFEAKGFYSTSRFLSDQEKTAFAGAKELRQISVRNLNGVEKATITVTMRGGSKGMPATALNRLAAGKYKTVETGKVAEDRTFSFEITKAGNYVVYTGKIDMGE